ncbi:MAG TPA: hypothetical protein VME45_21520, partial [Stellaceae bacterium]|nr:hypothetical protein [Stellaceae bacterium]
AGLTIGQLGVSAGSITLSAISGVYSNGGDIQIASLYPLFPFSGGLSTFNLTLDAPVNANNFVLGSPSTVLGKTPGLIQLIAQGGNLTQNATGVIIGGQLYAEADGGPNYLFGPGGNVELTADNRIGADDNKRGIAGSPGTYGRVAGFANNNFRFVNYDAPLTIDTLGCGCGGIFAYYGNIDLATKGAGDIAVDAPLNAGNNISIAVAEGYAFTNNAGNTDKNFRKQYITFIDEYYFTFPPLLAFPFTYGIDATAANGAVTILADQMNLSNGTIGGGIVVLGPKTHSEDIVLGTAGGSNTLSLQTADLANIVAGAVQVGYRLPDGAVSLTGDITISNKFAVNTDDIEGLLLVTGGSVNETGNGAIVGTDPSNPLELGIIASGSNSLDGANRVGTLAAYIDGANPSLSFTDARGLTVDTLAGFQAGVRLDAAGFPRARMTTGAVPDPLGGIVLAGGTTASLVTLTTTAGAITLNQPILAGAGTVTLDSARTVTEAEAGSITAGLLTGYSTGGALLVNPNVVSALGTWSDTGPRSAGFTLVDTEALTVTGGSVNSTGPVTLDVTAGDLILAPSALIIGDGIVLATTADFINDAGANVLALANGSRWLIYSDTPGGDMFGGLDSGNTAVWDVSYASLPPPSVTETGDRYLFQLSPTLTVTTVNDSKHYGTDDAAGIANDYVISGSVSGVAGAFLGDSLAALYTGTPSVTSAGSFALKFGGPFPVIATAGSLVALDGYQLSFVDGGELTVIGGPVFGASPEKYILPPPSWWGDLLTLQPGLTRCAPGSIAGALHDSGSVRLFGSGDESCGS